MAPQATLQVISGMLSGDWSDRLAGGLPVHINYPQGASDQQPPLPVPAQRVVIEVLEAFGAAVYPSGHCQDARTRAPDRAGMTTHPASVIQLCSDVADIVKLDISQHTPAGARRPGGRTEAAPPDTDREHVETVEEFERCLALGFDASKATSCSTHGCSPRGGAIEPTRHAAPWSRTSER